MIDGIIGYVIYVGLYVGGCEGEYVCVVVGVVVFVECEFGWGC